MYTLRRAKNVNFVSFRNVLSDKLCGLDEFSLLKSSSFFSFVASQTLNSISS
jgi:hypothetical protein